MPWYFLWIFSKKLKSSRKVLEFIERKKLCIDRLQQLGFFFLQNNRKPKFQCYRFVAAGCCKISFRFHWTSLFLPTHYSTRLDSRKTTFSLKCYKQKCTLETKWCLNKQAHVDWRREKLQSWRKKLLPIEWKKREREREKYTEAKQHSYSIHHLKITFNSLYTVVKYMLLRGAKAKECSQQPV